MKRAAAAILVSMVACGGVVDRSTSDGGASAPDATAVETSVGVEPEMCAQQHIGCGPAGDGCGGRIDCGTCPPGQTCGGGGFARCG